MTDLEPINPTKDAPKDEYGYVWGRYNISGWSFLRNFLENCKVDISEFSNLNDGEIISEKTCRAVAMAIRTYKNKLSGHEQKWLVPHAILWETCGGYRQK